MCVQMRVCVCMCVCMHVCVCLRVGGVCWALMHVWERRVNKAKWLTWLEGPQTWRQVLKAATSFWRVVSMREKEHAANWERFDMEIRSKKRKEETKYSHV